MTQTLLPSIDRQYQDNVRDLLDAAKKGDLKGVRDYIEATTKEKLLPVDACDETTKEQAIHRAADGGQVEILQFLVSKKPALVNGAIDDQGFTPLFHAAFAGKLDAVKFLVENGKASLKKKDKFGRMAKDMAASQGHAAVLNYLQNAKDLSSSCCCC